MLEIRRVEKEEPICTRDDYKTGVHQHGMSTESDLQILEQKMNKKIEEMEKTRDGKLDEKFNPIFAELDSRKETDNYHGGRSRCNNRRGQGNCRGNVSQVKGHSYDRRYQGSTQNREVTIQIIQVNPETCKGFCGWPISFYSSVYNR